MNKIIRLIAILFIVFVGCVTFYLYKLHSLAVEGNSIYEYRCLHVNPPLISYKKSFLKYADFLNSYPDTKYTPDEVKGFIDGYRTGMQAYIPEETKWLDMQKKFMDRWDFALIEPWYIKEGSVYQWKMYEGYRDDAVYLYDFFEHPDKGQSMKPGDVSETRQRRDTYIKKYFDFFDMAQSIHDWRKIFSYVPVPKGCKDENIMIPDTSGSIKWYRDTKESTPSGIPIDPYLAS